MQTVELDKTEFYAACELYKRYCDDIDGEYYEPTFVDSQWLDPLDIVLLANAKGNLALVFFDEAGPHLLFPSEKFN